MTFPAVIVSGLVINCGSAFLAVLLSAALGVFLLVQPSGSLYIEDPTDAVALVLFLATSLFIAVLIEDLHTAILELTAANRRLTVAEAEQNVLRQEAAHCRQNDLQRLISTLRLLAQASQDEQVRAALDAAIGRVLGCGETVWEGPDVGHQCRDCPRPRADRRSTRR